MPKIFQIYLWKYSINLEYDKYLFYILPCFKFILEPITIFSGVNAINLEISLAFWQYLFRINYWGGDFTPRYYVYADDFLVLQTILNNLLKPLNEEK